MIAIRSLYKAYNQNIVLTEINLHFKTGEINGIVGENGAGKTTLFKCIAGLEPCEGTIEYDGSKALKNVLGYLPTDLFFFPKMTGHEYLKLLCNARGLKTKNITQSNIFDLPLEQFAVNYSTGMKKKLALTGLLIQKNEVFILDEPYNGVDIQSNIIIQEILMKLKELGKTIIMSSHIFSTLVDSCDNLHYLKNGRIKTSAEKGDFSRIEIEMRGDGIVKKVSDLLDLD